MNPITHECRQGTQEWIDLRAKYFTASELAAAAGESKYQKRGDLLKQKATGIIPEVDSAKQRLFDAGHASEAAARLIVESQLGSKLFPATMSDEVEGLPLLASLDGITMFGDIIWENKLLNESLKAAVLNSQLESHYALQIEQQLLVCGAEKCYFTTSDGTPEGTFGMWYESDPELRMKIVATWRQFAVDLANYQHTETKEMPKADVTINLPALFVHAKGEITTHNMEEFGKALTAKLAETRAIVLVTDQDFSNAKSAASKFRETAKDIALAKKQMLEQTETIGEAARKMDAWAEDLNATALQLEKDVKREDLAKKEAMILAAKVKYTEHVDALEAETKPIRLSLVAPNFAEAIKGKSKYANMQDAVDTMLAGAIIAADQSAKDVREKLTWCKENAAGHSALFPDLQQIITKPIEDFALTITSRIDKAKADEAKRLEAEREKIRAEEQAKAQAEQRRIAEAEQAERSRVAAEEIRRLDAERHASEKLAAASQTQFDKTYPNGEPMYSKTTIKENGDPMMLDPDGKRSVFCDIDEGDDKPAGQTIKLGEICTRLGFTVNAEFLASLGIHPSATDKNAKLYPENKFPTICRLISEHVMALAFKKAA